MSDKSRDALLDKIINVVDRSILADDPTLNVKDEIRDLLDEHKLVLVPAEHPSVQQRCFDDGCEYQRARDAAKVRERIRKTGGDCHWNRMLEQIATALEEDGQ